MRVQLATSAGHGRPNEDFVAVVPGAVVLLDGAGIPGAGAVCSHGVVWYTRQLGGALIDRLSRDDGPDLVWILSEAIDEVAAEHRHSCDLAHPSSPQATVAIVRVDGDHLDHLVLADTFVVLDTVSAEPIMTTDDREVAAQCACAAPLAGLAAGTAEYERAWAACVRELRALRNQPGGYWIAKDDPTAAEEAVVGRYPLAGLRGFALLTNGASRLVSPYGMTDWPGLLHVLRTAGAGEVIDRVRRAEAAAASDSSGAPASPVEPDDATVVHGDLPALDNVLSR